VCAGKSWYLWRGTKQSLRTSENSARSYVFPYRGGTRSDEAFPLGACRVGGARIFVGGVAECGCSALCTHCVGRRGAVLGLAPPWTAFRMSLAWCVIIVNWAERPATTPWKVSATPVGCVTTESVDVTIIALHTCSVQGGLGRSLYSEAHGTRGSRFAGTAVIGVGVLIYIGETRGGFLKTNTGHAESRPGHQSPAHLAGVLGRANVVVGVPKYGGARVFARTRPMLYALFATSMGAKQRVSECVLVFGSST